jgi:magnesium transporter
VESTGIDVNNLEVFLKQRNFKATRKILRENELGDIGQVLERLPVSECIALIRLVGKERRTPLFSHFSLERQEELIEELPDVVVADIANNMEPDDRTHLLAAVPFEIRGGILAKLNPEQRQLAWQLLSYPEDSVGRLMTPEFFAIPGFTKVVDALAKIRWNSKVPEEHLNSIFVVDNEGKYMGDVSLAALVLADPPSTAVKDLMNSISTPLKVADDKVEAVDFFRKYDKPYHPVVDQYQVLKGMVTADDVFDVAEDEATEDIQQFGGQSTLEDSYFRATLFTLFRKRAGWLAMLFVGGIITAAALRHYEGITEQLAWLVFFVPLIISSGGNTGSQAAALVIRGIAVKEMMLRDWFSVFWRELTVGIGLGLVLGVMGYFRAITWDLPIIVALIVAVSLGLVVVFGAVTGAMLPFIFKRLNLDPAVSSSPLLASLVDIVGVLLFYNLARWVMANY